LEELGEALLRAKAVFGHVESADTILEALKRSFPIDVARIEGKHLAVLLAHHVPQSITFPVVIQILSESKVMEDTLSIFHLSDETLEIFSHFFLLLAAHHR
jgi:hypothetical protein